VSIAGPYGDEFKYAYDTANRVAAATDPAGATAHYEYDAEHRLRFVKLPDGRCVSYDYHKSTEHVVEERINRCSL
jgi:YD repeat-containing protein